MTSPATPSDDKELVEKVAEVVHVGRHWPGDEITPFADEGPRAKEYCRRIARAAIAAMPLSSREALVEIRADIDFACAAIMKLHEHKARARLEQTLLRIDALSDGGRDGAR